MRWRKLSSRWKLGICFAVVGLFIHFLVVIPFLEGPRFLYHLLFRNFFFQNIFLETLLPGNLQMYIVDLPSCQVLGCSLTQLGEIIFAVFMAAFWFITGFILGWLRQGGVNSGSRKRK